MRTYFLGLLTICLLCCGFTSNSEPEGLPPNLPSKIKGKYRVIEICGIWSVYDFEKYKKTSDGFKFYPPVHTYTYDSNRNKWFKDIVHEPLDNMCSPELVTFLEAGKKNPKKQVVKKEITGQEAVSIINSNLTKSSLWQLSSMPYTSISGKSGYIICGRNTVNAGVVGIWWSRGGEVMSVNGIAKGNTRNLNLTFEVETGEGLNQCRN